MHVVELAELAAVVAHHGPALLYRHASIPAEAVSCYWTASRQRLDLWHQTMIRFDRAKENADPHVMRCWWETHIGVLEEILVSELLTRVIAAIADGTDRASRRDEISPIAQSIYLSHLEVRNRVQALILDRRGCSVSDAIRLNRLRRTIERWIDVLIGQLAGYDRELVRYGIDVNRISRHAREVDWQATSPGRETIACLVRASLASSIGPKVSEGASLPHANKSIADSILLILRPDLFDSVGALKSLCLHRIENQVHRTDQMIDNNLRPNLDVSSTASAFDAIHGESMSPWFR